MTIFFFFAYYQVNLPKGSGYVEFKARADAEKAQLHMDGVRNDEYELFISVDNIFLYILCCCGNVLGPDRWEGGSSQVYFT